MTKRKDPPRPIGQTMVALVAARYPDDREKQEIARCEACGTGSDLVRVPVMPPVPVALDASTVMGAMPDLPEPVVVCREHLALGRMRAAELSRPGRREGAF